MTDHEIQSRSATSVRIFCTIDELDRESFNARTNKLWCELVIGYVEFPIRPFGDEICLHTDCIMISVGKCVRECAGLAVEDCKQNVAAWTEPGQVIQVSNTCSVAPSFPTAASYVVCLEGSSAGGPACNSQSAGGLPAGEPGGVV